LVPAGRPCVLGAGFEVKGTLDQAGALPQALEAQIKGGGLTKVEDEDGLDRLLQTVALASGQLACRRVDGGKIRAECPKDGDQGFRRRLMPPAA
jgi:hypothetical protein